VLVNLQLYMDNSPTLCYDWIMKVNATSLSQISPVVSRGIPISSPIPEMVPYTPKINFKKKHIILWVPGTNDHAIPAKFIEAVKQMFGDDAEVVMVDYMATPEFAISRPQGVLTLKATLDYIRAHNTGGSKIYLAGLSQGAMVISDIITMPAYSNMVERSVFMGHPGLSTNHFKHDSKVKEFNNPLDIVTFDWAEDGDMFIQKITKFLRGDILAGVSLLGTIVHHPLESLWAGLLYLHRVPFLHFPKFLETDPHDYTASMDDAVSWLRLGINLTLKS